MNAPCRHKATVVGHQDGPNRCVASVGLIGQDKIRNSFIDRDGERYVGIPTGVVGVHRVRRRCLIVRRRTGDGAVGEDEVSRQRRVNRPTLSKTSGV